MAEAESEPKHLRIGEAWSGRTVIQVVRAAFPDLEPRRIRPLTRSGGIRLNHGWCAPDTPVTLDDWITVLRPRTPPPPPRPVRKEGVTVDTEAGPFGIVREDDDLLVVSKVAGCASHPAGRHREGTLIQRVRAYLETRPEHSFQPALANRLDLDTSGIVFVPKTPAARKRLGRHLQQGRVRKFYLTLVDGWPDPAAGEVREPLARRPDSRDLHLPDHHPRRRPRLQDAITRYRTLHRCDQPVRCTVLAVELLTGRTHQIRRHLTHFGHPVGGDRRYGDPAFNRDLKEIGELDRMFLHAAQVALEHPTTGESLECVAPLPAELVRCLSAFGVPHGLAGSLPSLVFPESEP